MSVRRYQDLHAWQKAMQLGIQSYRIAAAFPAHERYGLAAQLRRAAVSISLNIAEGHGRSSRREFAHFVSIARGSTMEVEVLLLFAEQLRYQAPEQLAEAQELCDAVSRMLTQLRRALTR